MLKKCISLLLASLLFVSCALADDVMRPGDTGDDVKELQTLLTGYGYYDGKIDGEYGSATTSAVKLFQEYNDLTRDGKAGPKTMAKLKGSHVITPADKKAEQADWLQKGSSGDKVKELQQHLANTLFYAGEMDGVFGEAVKKAVTEFQKAAGIQADGIVGAATRNALYNRTAGIFNGGYPLRTLYSGCRGYDVKLLQQRLSQLNYFNAPVTGYFCDKTAAAVRAFQKDNGMYLDGSADAIVRRHLWPTTSENQPDKYPKLEKGDAGAYVTQAQMRLKAAGFLDDTADGVYGDNTLSAVKAFQKAYKLTVDGKIGRDTWAMLMTIDLKKAEPEAAAGSMLVLRPGAKGKDVKELQEYLVALGYKLQVDGKYGKETTAAVKAFQQAQSLKTDGKAGPRTLGRIYDLLSK